MGHYYSEESNAYNLLLDLFSVGQNWALTPEVSGLAIQDLTAQQKDEHRRKNTWKNVKEERDGWRGWVGFGTS